MKRSHFGVPLLFSALVGMLSCGRSDTVAVIQSAPQREIQDPCSTFERLTFDPLEAVPRSVRGLTEGLVLEEGALYESTGSISGHGPSVLNRIDPRTGEVTQLRATPDQAFGEGLVKLNGMFYQLTYREGKIHQFVSDGTPAGTRLTRTFVNPMSEGWGLTTDGQVLLATNGSSTLYRLDPTTLKVVGHTTVRSPSGRAVKGLNELEYVNGQIYAHIFPTSKLIRFDAKTGCQTGEADLTALSEPFDCPGISLECNRHSVANGIAFDVSTSQFYITGKSWPVIYRGRFLRQ